MESARFSWGFRMLNGNIFDFDHPEKADYNIELVATILGKKCRFSDHIDRHYSIAEHSCHAHDLYPRNRKGALMHDSPEFVLDDVITPIKRRLQGYKPLEERVSADMERRFDFVMPDELTFKPIDNLLFHQEELALYPGTDPIYDIKIPFGFWSPKKAAREFLKRFHALADTI